MTELVGPPRHLVERPGHAPAVLLDDHQGECPVVEGDRIEPVDRPVERAIDLRPRELRERRRGSPRAARRAGRGQRGKRSAVGLKVMVVLAIEGSAEQRSSHGCRCAHQAPVRAASERTSSPVRKNPRTWRPSSTDSVESCPSQDQSPGASTTIAVIGGSGLYELFDDSRVQSIETPLGVRAEVAAGLISGRPALFLPRHGRDHSVALTGSMRARRSGRSRAWASAHSSRRPPSARSTPRCRSARSVSPTSSSTALTGGPTHSSDGRLVRHLPLPTRSAMN